MIDFSGQVVVVTGAGRGLGRLYALDFAKRGAAVVVNDVGGSMGGDGSDATVAQQVVAEIEDAGGRAVASHDSVATVQGGQAIVDTAVDTFGRLDAVVSNAGIFHTSPFDELSPDDWRRMLNVHLDGGFHLSQPAFKVMKRQGYGRFVFIVSSAGLFGQPNSAHYAAAKAGLMGLTNVIAIQGRPTTSLTISLTCRRLNPSPSRPRSSTRSRPSASAWASMGSAASTGTERKVQMPRSLFSNSERRLFKGIFSRYSP